MAMLENRDPRTAPSAGLLHGRVQHYAWGSRSIIAALQGRPSPSAQPEAELWFGAHPSAPAWFEEPVTGGRVPLDLAIAEDPVGMLGEAVLTTFGARLPFLLKVLAVGAPLSLQAHPSAEQARAGFLAEESAGIPRDAITRRFPDDWPKPEVLHALTPVTALCGFRDVDATLSLLDALDVLPTVRARLRRDGPKALRDVVGALLTLPEERRAPLVAEVQAAAKQAAARQAVGGGDDGARWGSVAGADQPDAYGRPEGPAPVAASHGVHSVSETADIAAWIDRIATRYPHDPGVAVALLLDLVRIAPGSALGVPTGRLHAYLEGAGVEIMAASDNVLRGGLTAKHVDVPGLLEVLDATAGERLAVEPHVARPRVVEPQSVGPQSVEPQSVGPRTARPLSSPHASDARDAAQHRSGAPTTVETAFPMATANFALSRFTFAGGHRDTADHGPGQVSLARRGPEILLCTQGSVSIVVDDRRLTIRPGQAVFVAARAREVVVVPEPDRSEGRSGTSAAGPWPEHDVVPDPEPPGGTVIFRATVGDVPES